MINWENEKENLRRMYVEEGLNCREISEKYGVKSDTISGNLKKLKIFRTKEDELRIKIQKDPNIVRICKYCGKIFYSSKKKYRKYQDYCCQKCASKDQRKSAEDEVLIKQLEENNWNYSKVGRLNGVTDNAIRKKIKRLGLYKKCHHDWSDVVDLESAQRKIDELGIRMAMELHKNYGGLSDRIGRLNLLSFLKFPGTDFDSSWEERMFNLIKDNISFTSLEHNIILSPECCYVNPLIFDIIIEYPNSTKVIIEIQGPAHFKDMYKDDIRSFSMIKKRDEIKYQYCLDNNIDLYYFTYDQSLIDTYGYPHYVYTDEQLLLEKLKSYSLK